MSDELLRRVERALAGEPQSVDLRRQHARALSRAGRNDDALAALDLAWRLGADDLRAELNARLLERRLQVGATTLCYVPAGPFVMGSEEFDDDASPAHLVELSAYYLTREPVIWAALEDWENYPEHWRRPNVSSYVERWRKEAYRTQGFEQAEGIATFLNTAAKPEGLVGSYRLVTEAQWERAFRAAYLSPDGNSPYGAVHGKHPEWTRDRYESTFYDHSPRVDPVALPKKKGEQRVVRGIAAAPVPQHALFRESAREDGCFPVGRNPLTRRWVQHEGGLAVRLAFVPDSTP